MTKSLLCMMLLVLTAACTKNEPKSAEMLRLEQLQKQAAVIEKQLGEIDQKMAASNTDFGLQAELRNQRELARSRLMRIKASMGLTENQSSGTARH